MMSAQSAQQARIFLAELEALKEAVLQDFSVGRFGQLSVGQMAVPARPTAEAIALLKAMVYPERIAADILARRIPQIPDLDIKERVAEQAAEELHHLAILREML